MTLQDVHLHYAVEVPACLYSWHKIDCMEVMLLHQQSLVYHPTISEYYGMFCALIINC